MLVKETFGEQYILKTMDELVRKDHLLRSIKKYIDFDFVYDIVGPYYSDKGRPGIDPKILFKMLFVKYLYGIKSIRRLVNEIEENIAYRWFCEIDYDMEVPHFDTISKNYMRRYKDTDVYEQIFNHILNLLEENNLLNTKTVYMDSTHIKANANKKKSEIKIINEEKKAFEDELLSDINKQRRKDKKKEYKEKPKKTKEQKTSLSDSECGFFHKGEHEQIFGYNEHVVCEKRGYILNHKAKPSNIHDSQVFSEVMEEVINKYEEIENIAVDSGYKTGSICKYIMEKKKKPLMPYKNNNRTTEENKNNFKKNDFKYNHKRNIYICKNKKILTYKSVDRNGYLIYKGTKKECDNCPFKSKCCPKTPTKQITHSIYQDQLNYTNYLRYNQEFREEYKTRSQTIERDFGDLKEKHGMRYTYLKGIKKVEDENNLRFACFNIKKMVLYLSKYDNEFKYNEDILSNNSLFSNFIIIFIYFINNLKRDFSFSF